MSEAQQKIEPRSPKPLNSTLPLLHSLKEGTRDLFKLQMRIIISHRLSEIVKVYALEMYVFKFLYILLYAFISLQNLMEVHSLSH